MKFKPGERVICTEPIGVLEPDKVYEVTKCYISRAPGGFDGQENEWVHLKDMPGDPYFAFRFKSYKDDSDPVTIQHFGDAIRDIPPIHINHVDEGLTMTAVASKNDKDKIDLSLIPRISNIEHAKAFMVGERKYGRYNYTKGHKASQLIAAMMRHAQAWNEGEEHDPTDGQHHLGSVMACCSMILRQQELGTLKDDRFVLGTI